MLIDRATTRENSGGEQLEHWEIEGLNDEDITAELLDERVELSTVVPLWDCSCDTHCQMY
ncbi:hypothetical protein EPA93_17470 [Ktedonosporobacter rubrisoli]|uniref:Uncharacterized protein n=1 Tax=Ktedonosporobacter rubrisoli TaxID=2509675 RepID=A0A4P6JR68_KTERU|nr:hypothetical protein [Ktedonosporobacter rubrisoli]QBD77682.1 hypothetical protein EPA93_17470 [Ktedonosporobacter rubrisoli]